MDLRTRRQKASVDGERFQCGFETGATHELRRQDFVKTPLDKKLAHAICKTHECKGVRARSLRPFPPPNLHAHNPVAQQNVVLLVHNRGHDLVSTVELNKMAYSS